jgi:hypothetical protein
VHGEVGVGVADEVEPVGSAGVVRIWWLVDEEPRCETKWPVVFVPWPIVVVV